MSKISRVTLQIRQFDVEHLPAEIGPFARGSRLRFSQSCKSLTQCNLLAWNFRPRACVKALTTKAQRTQRKISVISVPLWLKVLGYCLTIQTSFESSLSFASLARASASEENFTRTLNVAPDRSTKVDMKPWSIAFAASASAVF